MTIRVLLILSLLLFSSSFPRGARCEPDPDSDVVESVIEEGGDLGIVGEDVQDFSSGSFSPAPWVETKTKKAPEVEVGTRATDTSMDEWLQGTAYTQSASTKLRKK